jgi:hypothetical protein
MVGYSRTSLVKKLGIKTGFRISVVNPPVNYFKLLGKLPEPVEVLKKPTSEMDFIHFFSTNCKEYEKSLLGLKKKLTSNGMIWVSWPKAASKMPTDLNDRVVRDFALKNGLVDIKVCAVDETWSALKFVIPVKDRK